MLLPHFNVFTRYFSVVLLIITRFRRVSDHLIHSARIVIYIIIRSHNDHWLRCNCNGLCNGFKLETIRQKHFSKLIRRNVRDDQAKIRHRICWCFIFPNALTARKCFFFYVKPSNATRFERNEIKENGISIYRQNPILVTAYMGEIFVFKGTLFTEKKGVESPVVNTGFFFSKAGYV